MKSEGVWRADFSMASPAEADLNIDVEFALTSDAKTRIDAADKKNATTSKSKSILRAGVSLALPDKASFQYLVLNFSTPFKEIIAGFS
jgi:hypothetical protein